MCEYLFAESSIRKSESGLPANIYVSCGGSVAPQRAPVIHVMKTDADLCSPLDTFTVPLNRDLNEADIAGHAISSIFLVALRQYININHDVLMAYWNDDISTKEMFSALKSL